MSKGIIETIAGAALVATGAILEVVTFGASTPLTVALINAGVGLTLAGIGTMLAKGPIQGFATTTRNPVSPWEIVYGRKRVGGTVIYLAEFGSSNKYLDMVIVLAAHKCEAVDELLFDNQRIQIGAHNTSFTPVQQDVSIANISRTGSVVTVVLNHDIPLLSDGDQVIIHDNHPASNAFNGRFGVTIISRVPGGGGAGSITFSFLSGGPATGGITSGMVRTAWPDYKNRVYMETMLGDQLLGTTFYGMTNGTPEPGNSGNLIQNNANGPNPWTNYCSLVGKTAVFLRLAYDSSVFVSGIPQISFHIRGKNDILDPRNIPPTRGYTENAALCIADYLSNTTWGFKAVYDTEIDTARLIAAANTCDEAVPIASPLGATEPRYTCNGGFPLTMKRAEVLQNMLTCCAGRLTYVGGMFGIWPATWLGVGTTLSGDFIYNNAAAPIRWKPTVSISNLFNGVKGTYISPVNNWQSSDFPRYAQNGLHGYNNGPPELEYDQNLADDGGDRRWKEIQLPFTISPSMAQRLAKIELMRLRQQGTGTFALNMAGYTLASMDILAISLPYFGWDGKYLEVLATRFKLDRQQSITGEATLLGTEIDVQETDPSVYDWELIEQLSPQGYQQPNVPDSLLKPDPPTNLYFTFDDAAGALSTTGWKGAVTGNVVLRWTAPTDGYVLNGGSIQGRYQLIESPPGLWIGLGTYNATVTQLTMPVLLPGLQYLVELRSENTAGVPSDWTSIVYTPISLPSQWMPYAIQADPNDALFPNEYRFAVELAYSDLMGVSTILADGGAAAKLNISGVQPTTQVIAGCPPPIITAVDISLDGGFIVGGTPLYVCVTADDGAGNHTLPSALFSVILPAGTALALTLTVTWPNTFVGLTNYTIYASPLVDLVSAQQWGGVLAYGPSSPPTSPPSSVYGPATVILAGFGTPASGPLIRSTWAPPNPNVNYIRLKGRGAYHDGVLGAGITSLGLDAYTIIASDCVDVSGLDNWTGRALIIVGRNNVDTFPLETIPFATYRITAFDVSTGAFTVDRPTSNSPASDQDLRVGDAFAVCTQGYDNSADPYRVQDAGWSNSLNYDFDTQASTPHSGLTPNREKNMVLRVIAGTSRGAKANVVANTGDTHILDDAILLGPDSVWIILESGTPYPMDSNIVANSNPFSFTELSLPIPNLLGRSVYVEGVLVNQASNESQSGNGPGRLVFVYGALGLAGDLTAITIGGQQVRY